jgi:hypothetical protein
MWITSATILPCGHGALTALIIRNGIRTEKVAAVDPETGNAILIGPGTQRTRASGNFSVICIICGIRYSKVPSQVSQH